MAACRGWIVSPPVIWLKVWIANGAVPSDAGSRSAYTRSVVPGVRSPGARSLSTRWAQTICSVAVIRRASDSSGQSTDGFVTTDCRNSRRPTAKMPPLRRISSSLGESGTGSYAVPCVSLVSLRVRGSKVKLSPSRASATASGLCTTCSPRLKLLRRKMSPMLLPATTTSSRPASSATPFNPAGLISRDDPIAKRSPAMMKVSPRCTRSRKSGIRWRNDPAFHFSSRVSRLSETQSAAGVIWSVSMASSFFANVVPGRLIGSQKMRAFPWMRWLWSAARSSDRSGSASTLAPGLRTAGSIVCIGDPIVAPTKGATADAPVTAAAGPAGGTRGTTGREPSGNGESAGR